MNCPTYHYVGHLLEFYIKAIGISHMKAYICDKHTSSVNDVKCSNAIVWEFMNKTCDINI